MISLDTIGPVSRSAARSAPKPDSTSFEEVTRILVLGWSMAASSCIEYLAREARNEITVGCKNINEAKRLADPFENVSAIRIDVHSQEQLNEHAADSSVIVALLPEIDELGNIIKAAIHHRTCVVTTTTVLDALDSHTRRVGMAVLHEGNIYSTVSRLYAMRRIDQIHAKGGKIREFHCYYGCLPTPQSIDDNPLGFKWFWNPSETLLLQREAAKYLKDGRVVEVAPDDLMASAKPYHGMTGYELEWFPCRDSVVLRDSCGIPEAHTVISGSLRYKGNALFVGALVKLGWIDREKKEWLKDGMTWAEIQQRAIDAPGEDERSLKSKIKEVCKFANQEESERIISGLKWIGLFSSEVAPVKEGNLLDTLGEQLEKLISYDPGDCDAVMLQHKLVVEWEDGKTQTFLPTLELVGDEDEPAIGRGIGLTCAIATQLLADSHPGVCRPGLQALHTESIREPFRRRLQKEGIEMVDRRVPALCSR